MTNSQDTFHQDLLQRLARRWLWPLAGLIIGLKALFAVRLELYSDEIFYWLESTRPALAYSDLPFMSALFTGLGAAAFGETPFAVRIVFFLMGCSLPATIYWVALPLVGKIEAREAALLSLCLPLASSLGLLAVPDVPLVFFGLLAIGFFTRARTSNATILWVATGVVVALGLATHYRFSLFPAGAILLLLWDTQSRHLWRNPRTLLAFAVAAVGLMPVIMFNIANKMGSLTFYLVDRHPWEFRPEGLLHLFEQALISTPLMYGLLLATATCALRNATPSARLIACIAVLHIALFAALAPWSDPTSTTIHWPLAGTIPLLVYAPAALRRLTAPLPSKHLAIALVVAMGYLGSLLALIGVGSQSLHKQLQPLLGVEILSTKMAGWTRFAAETRRVIADNFERPPLLVTDNYYTAAQLVFAGIGEAHATYTLDAEKAIRDGRALQLSLWEMDAVALSKRDKDAVALLITEDSTLNFEQKRAVLKQACGLSGTLELVEQIELLGGAKRFAYYALKLNPKPRTGNCPIPARGWIDSPLAGTSVDENFTVSGWAFAEGSRVEQIRLLIDGKPLTNTGARTERRDIDVVEGARLDSDFPMVGFSMQTQTETLKTGTYELKLELINSNGEISTSLPTEFTFLSDQSTD